jgi:uroporphyrinogen-III decarboxylase
MMAHWVDFDISKYETRREESRKRLQAAHEFREGDRVACVASVAGSYFSWLFGVDIRDYYTDIDTQIEVQMRGLQWRYENLPDDFTGSGIGYDAGPIGEALVFDCDIEYPQGTSPFIVRFIHDAADVEKLEVKDPRDNPRVQEHLEKGRRFKQRAEELGVRVPIGTGGIGIHPPLSCACAIADVDWVYMSMLAEPDVILRLFDKCYQAFCMCQEYMYQLHGGGPGSLGLADDNSAFVSDELYRRLVLPYNLALYETYGPNRRYLHADGPNEHHYETYARIIRLNHMDIGGWSKLRPAVDILKPAGCIVHGGLNNRDLYSGWTERLRQKIRQTIRIAAPGGGFEFAIGGETYAGTDPDVLCKTFEYAHDVGRFPLDIPEEKLPGEDDGVPVWEAVTL